MGGFVSKTPTPSLVNCGVARELRGRTWSLAHNGKLPGIKNREFLNDRPVGTPDSEHAFCWIMDQLRERWPKRPRSKKQVSIYIGEFTVFHDGEITYTTKKL